MSKVELTIKVDYLPGWGTLEGIRELVQNAKDAETEFSAPMTVRVRNSNVLVIENEGCTLPYESLLLGHTSKVGHEELIGKFGEGMKLGILALLRAGHTVKIRNGSEVWTPAIEMSDRFKCKVLTFDIVGGRKDEHRVQIEISGISARLFRDEIRPRFLWLDKDDAKAESVPTEYGTLLLGAPHRGRIFVKGIFVEHKPDLTVGYDFADCDVDRDRRMVSSWTFQWKARQIWGSAVRTRPDLTDRFLGLLDENAAEVQGLSSFDCENISDEVKNAAVRAFVSKYGTTAVPVQNLAESCDLEHFGRQGIIVPSALRNVLEAKMGPMSKVQEGLKSEVTKVYGWHELTPPQRQNLEGAIRRVAPHSAVALDEVSVCDFRSPGLMGTFSTDGIRLAASVVAESVTCLATLIHEVAHRRGHDGDAGHVAELERIWSGVFAAEVKP